MKQIDINTWNRKEHFEFFSSLKSPYLGITSNVKCTEAYKSAKSEKKSFFAYYMHKSILVVNQIPEFKYRIIDGKVFEMDSINIETTIGREDNTFAFSYVKYDADFEVFNRNLKEEIDAVKNSIGLRHHPDNPQINVIHYTTIPWISFTALLHPNNHNQAFSIPKISFGKMFEDRGEFYLPTSIEANHGLMDGYHIGKYFQEFEKLLNS